MEEELAPGLYELLVTEALAERLEDLKSQGRTAREARLDPAEAPAMLARHVGRVTEQVLALVKDDQRVAAANELVRLAGQLAGDDVQAGAVVPALLTEIPSAELGVHYVRPQIPLSRTDLLVNPRGEPGYEAAISDQPPARRQVGVDVDDFRCGASPRSCGASQR